MILSSGVNDRKSRTPGRRLSTGVEERLETMGWRRPRGGSQTLCSEDRTALLSVWLRPESLAGRGGGALGGRIKRPSMNLLRRELCLSLELSAVLEKVGIFGTCTGSIYFVVKIVTLYRRVRFLSESWVAPLCAPSD